MVLVFVYGTISEQCTTIQTMAMRRLHSVERKQRTEVGWKAYGTKSRVFISSFNDVCRLPRLMERKYVREKHNKHSVKMSKYICNTPENKTNSTIWVVNLSLVTFPFTLGQMYIFCFDVLFLTNRTKGKRANELKSQNLKTFYQIMAKNNAWFDGVHFTWFDRWNRQSLQPPGSFSPQGHATKLSYKIYKYLLHHEGNHLRTKM